MKRLGLVLGLSAVLAGAPGGADIARAQAAAQVETNFKGAVGLGLFGAELGFVIPALAGVEDTWAYIVFPILGAGVGGVTGYFTLDQMDSPGASVAALAVGMALVIPSLVLTLSATAYDPEDEGIEVESSADVGVSTEELDPESSGGASGSVGGSIGGGASTSTGAEPTPASEPAPAPSPTSRLDRLRNAGPGVLRLTEDGVAIGAPGLALVATNRTADLARRVDAPELHVPVVSGTF